MQPQGHWSWFFLLFSYITWVSLELTISRAYTPNDIEDLRDKLVPLTPEPTYLAQEQDDLQASGCPRPSR
jgi:hypothetical protein